MEERESQGDGLIDRALELLMDGYYDEAQNHLESVLKKEPNNYEAWFYLGNVYIAKRLYEDAARCYSRVIELNPNYQDAYVSLADAYLRMGKIKRAKRLIVRGAKRFNDENYLYGAAVVLVGGGEYELAEELIRKLLDRKKRAEYLVLLGNLYFGKGMYDEALKWYDKAIEKDPDNVEAWNNKGFLMFIKGLYKEALHYYKKALEIDPNYKEAWYNRGYAHHAIGKLRIAVADYWHALKIDPRDEVAWNNMGNALYNLGRYMESIPYFMKAVQVNPNYEISWNNIGNALNKIGLHRESLPFHEKALSINPKFDYAWHAKGHALCELGDYENAFECLENAIELNPEYGETWYWRGYVLFKLGMYEESIESLKKALEKEKIFEALELLGDIYSQLDYEVEAMKYYERATKIAEGDALARIYLKMGNYEKVLESRDDELKARILYKLGRYDEILQLKSMETLYYRCLALEALGRFEEAYKLAKKGKGEKFEREKRFLEYMLGNGEFEMDLNDKEFQLRVGSLLLERGEFKRALRLFEKVKNRDGYYFRGEANLALGRLKEARKCFEISAGLGSELALERLMEVSKIEKVPS